MKKIIISVIIVGLLLNVTPISASIKKSSLPFRNKSGNTLYVGGTGPENYSNIQVAIDAASNGDTIFVYNGTYYGHLIITKTITLVGEDKDTTIIDGEQYYGGVIRIFYTSGVNITGFTIKNSSIAGEERSISGIYIDHSNYVLISGCKLFEDTCGIALDYSENNTIKFNKFIKVYTDLHLWHGSNNNVISDNEICNNLVGIDIYRGSNNVIFNNNMYRTNQTEYIDDYVIGIRLGEGASYNTVYHNNLINNKIGKYYAMANNAVEGWIGQPPGDGNLWYNPVLKEGNYYDDYLGMDEDGDGIGDTPHNVYDYYNVPENETNPDLYPLMRARGIQSNPPNKPTIDGPRQIKAGTLYNYTAVTTDPDEDKVRYFYDWGDGNTEWGQMLTWVNGGWGHPSYWAVLFFFSSGEINIEDYAWQKKGDYTIKVKARDIYGYESDWATLPITVPLEHQNIQSHPQSTPQSQPSSQPSSKPISKTTTQQTIVGSTI